MSSSMTRSGDSADPTVRYPPPEDHPIFVKMWNKLVRIIATRENFLEHHLAQLEILCGMYVELNGLNKDIDLEGMTYESEGRNGTQIKLRPQAQQRNRVRAEIRSYSQILGLTIAKAKGPEGDGNKPQSEWD